MNILILAFLTPMQDDLVEIGVLFGVVALVSFFGLVYFYKIHNRKRRKRKQKHSRSGGRTSLAEQGGLPPVRPAANKSETTPES
jgi:hypothetical protein